MSNELNKGCQVAARSLCRRCIFLVTCIPDREGNPVQRAARLSALQCYLFAYQDQE